MKSGETRFGASKREERKISTASNDISQLFIDHFVRTKQNMFCVDFRTLLYDSTDVKEQQRVNQMCLKTNWRGPSYPNRAYWLG